MNINILRRLGAFPCRWRSWGLAGILSLLSFGVLAGGVIDLGYKVTRGGTPLTQVYDDGARTYLVFARDLDPWALRQMARSIMATREGKVHFVPLNPSAPYPSIDGVYDQIVLTVGGRQAMASYVGSRRQTAEREAQEQASPAEAGKRIYIQKTPVQEVQADAAQENLMPGSGQWIRPVPGGASPPAGPPSPENIPGQPGWRKDAANYAGSRRQPAIEQVPPVEGKERYFIQKTPLPEVRGTQEAMVPGSGQAAAAVPAGTPPLAKEVLPSNQVVKVMAARSEDPLPPSPVSSIAAERDEAGRAAAGGANDFKVEYKVQIPFTAGKTVLGKEGEKAMTEVTQIGPLAKEIRIRVPGDPGSIQSAHGRAAEIHKLLVKAGMVRQRISIEAVEAAPDGNKVVQAEVALIIDLGPKGKINKVDNSTDQEPGRPSVR